MLDGSAYLLEQYIRREFINLLNNSFYAVHKKERSHEGNGAYEPTVSLSTHRIDGYAEIRISDNGPGFPTPRSGPVRQVDESRPFFWKNGRGPAGSGDLPSIRPAPPGTHLLQQAG